VKQKKLFEESETKIFDKIPLDVTQTLGAKVLAHVSEWLKPVEVVGSVRRKKPFCKDIDIVGVATPSDFENAIKALCQNFKTEFKVKGKKVTRLYIETEFGKVQVDFYCATPSTFGIHKLIRTGSADHNMWLANYAMSKGMRIKYSEGLVKEGVVVAGKSESGVFEALGLSCPEPHEREVVDGKPVWLQNF